MQLSSTDSSVYASPVNHPQACVGRIAILGTRGVPACHGGFETFAERLSLWLVERGWRVQVFCQCETENGAEKWQDVDLTQIRVRTRGSLGSIEFDMRSTLCTAGRVPLALILGYNTAVFNLLHRLRGTVSIVNMDGLEWKRSKWSWPVKQWFRLNERSAAHFSHHLIADHPVIAERLAGMTARERISTIPYGADRVTSADSARLRAFGLSPRKYAISIARVERENQTLEIVRGFSRKRRGIHLAVLGTLDPSRNAYHRAVLNAAGPEVRFLGPIYERESVQALRTFALLHIHGHTVGGTNPTLVEALGAGCPILAHDNPFNCWVAGPNQRFFADETCLDDRLTDLLKNPSQLEFMSRASHRRHAEAFTWEPILKQYESLIERMYPR